jgi:muconolactone delta-isomerase
MLFLVISTPRAERPSEVSARRQEYWRWLAPLQRGGQCKWAYGRTGRGAVALFDVDSNETLHRLLNEWAEIIPATFEVYPLIDSAAAKRFLGNPRNPTAKKKR